MSVLERLEEMGFSVEAGEGGKLRVSYPAAQPPPEAEPLIEQMVAQRSEVLRLFAEVKRRAAVMSRQIAASVGSVQMVSSTRRRSACLVGCAFCGEPIEPEGRYCSMCRRAAVAVLGAWRSDARVH